jgi:hypothetical protein
MFLLTFALAKIAGGMILSGPKACRGSMKDARILPAFLHSPAPHQYFCETSVWLRIDLLLMEEGIGLLIPKGILTLSRALLVESCLSSGHPVLYHGVLHNFRDGDQWWTMASASGERLSVFYKCRNEACQIMNQ